MTKKRLMAIRGLTYPEPGESLKLVRSAGGVSKLTPEEHAQVQFRRIEPGQWCDDLPPESRAHLIGKGAVEIVEEPEVEESPKEPRQHRRLKGD